MWFTSNWQEKFELWRKLIFGIESVGEVDSSDSAVGVDLNAQSLDIVGTVGTTSEIGQVELNLIPSFIESHGHSTDERLNTSSTLIVRSSESSSHVLVIKYLNFESEVFFQLKGGR